MAHAFAAARAFLFVGALFALTDRLGFRPFDFEATIILLTAVHFHFAGVALVLAGALAYRHRPSRWIEFAIGAVVVGIPLTALGFFGLPVANWVGSLLVALGGFGIGVATWRSSGWLATRGPRARSAGGRQPVGGHADGRGLLDRHVPRDGVAGHPDDGAHPREPECPRVRGPGDGRLVHRCAGAGAGDGSRAMKVVILGGSGRIGRALTVSLLGDGHTVTVLSRAHSHAGAADRWLRRRRVVAYESARACGSPDRK